MRVLLTAFLAIGLLSLSSFAQTNEWTADYVTYDDAINGTGDQTTSAAVVGPDRFVAIVCQTPTSPLLDNIFDPPGNYLVGYWDADSGIGRVPSPINGSQTVPLYNIDGQFTDWASGLDLIQLKGAYTIASGSDNLVYVANNDEDHNILVFELSATGVVATDFRMETGSEDIFAIEVDDSGYVYVANYKGDVLLNDEVKVYAGIDAPGNTWGTFGGHNDAPVATIDLPEGTYYGLTVSGDGTTVYVSSHDDRSILKFTGDPVNGYTQDQSWSLTLSPEDTVGNGGNGTPSYLGLAYMDDPGLLFACVDTVFGSSNFGGYPYGRIYQINPGSAVTEDTIDVAEWNLAITGAYNNRSGEGRAGGYTSLVDLDVEASEPALYSTSYYGWTVEKWIFDGTLVSIEPIDAAIPGSFTLSQNYPNPFNPRTTIEFEIQQSVHVTLSVYNLLGQKVTSLLDEQMAAGSYRAVFDAGNLPSGVYIYELQAGDFKAAKRMSLVK